MKRILSITLLAAVLGIQLHASDAGAQTGSKSRLAIALQYSRTKAGQAYDYGRAKAGQAAGQVYDFATGGPAPTVSARFIMQTPHLDSALIATIQEGTPEAISQAVNAAA